VKTIVISSKVITDCDVSSSPPVCDVGLYPFSLCARTPATSLSPSCLNWPCGRPVWKVWFWIPNHQTNGLFSPSSSCWDQFLAITLKFCIANSAVFLYQGICMIFGIFALFTYYTYSLLLVNLIYSILCFYRLAVFSTRSAFPPYFCVSPTQRRYILHSGTLATEQPEKIPGLPVLPPC
jgi:hypothetical protein